MFGRQNDQFNQQQDSSQIPQQSLDGALGGSGSQQVPAVPPPFVPAASSVPALDSSVGTSNAPGGGTDEGWQHPGLPLESDPPAPATISPAPPLIPVSSPQDNTVDPLQSTPVPSNPSGLLDIKQQALSQLSPLVGHLDQTPEEKFRTTMMMIQASDDQSMIGTAFEAAQAISDEKVRAQALLDVINEINYFTQNQSSNQ